MGRECLPALSMGQKQLILAGMGIFRSWQSEKTWGGGGGGGGGLLWYPACQLYRGAPVRGLLGIFDQLQTWQSLGAHGLYCSVLWPLGRRVRKVLKILVQWWGDFRFQTSSLPSWVQACSCQSPFFNQSRHYGCDLPQGVCNTDLLLGTGSVSRGFSAWRRKL